MRVCSLLRKSQGYPHEAVLEGVRAAGDEVVEDPSDAEALITWNCYGHAAEVAKGVKARGGLHVVMENGYVARDRGYYIMERGGFNGYGEPRFVGMGPGRWDRLHEPLESWRVGGEYVLVVGQRGGAYSPLAMPNEWPEGVILQLRQFTDRPIRYRPHPARQRLPTKLPNDAGIVSHERSLDDQIRRAAIVVGWTSSAMIRALQLGVPVIYRGPRFVLSELASVGFDPDEIEAYFSDEARGWYPTERPQAFWDLAWKQWHIDEIREGKAWRRVTRD